MRKLLTLLALFIFVSFSLSAQNEFNKTDKQGRRQGKWVDYHLNGNIRCVGDYKDNEPSGEFVYYSEGGNMIAKGRYQAKKKHGRWEFYSDKNSSLILVESYDNGVVDGKSLAYSAVTGAVIEEVEYVDGVKNGILNKYYDNGRQMVRAHYKDDLLDGPYISYYPNGVIKEEGTFVEGEKVGEWKTYDMEENIISVDTYQ